MADQHVPDDDERPAFFDDGVEECDELDEEWQPPALPPMSPEEIERRRRWVESDEALRAELERTLAEEQHIDLHD